MSQLVFLFPSKESTRAYLLISIINELRANRIEEQPIHRIRKMAAIPDNGNVHGITRRRLLENHEQAQYEANGQRPKAQFANHRAPDQAKSNSFPKRREGDVRPVLSLTGWDVNK